MRILFAFLLICLAFLTGCYYDSRENLYPVLNCTDTVNVTYTIKIKPILDSRCNSCHYSGSSSGGNIALDSYSVIKTQVDNGNLLNSILQNGKVNPMPKNSPRIDDCKLTAISIWIKAGAPNN